MLTLGMEPMVVDFLKLSSLFKSRIFFVDEVDEVFVVSDDSQFAGRDIDIVKDNVLKS